MGRRTLRKPVTRRTMRRSPDYRSVPPAAPDVQAAPAPVPVKATPAAEDARGGTLRPPKAAPEASTVASKTATLPPPAAPEEEQPAQGQARVAPASAPLAEPSLPAPERQPSSMPAASAVEHASHESLAPAAPVEDIAPSGGVDGPQQHADGEAMHEAFFAVGDSGYPAHDDDSIPAVPMARGTRVAMRVSMAMFVGFLVAIGGYLVYHKVVMPTPVAVGGTEPLSMDSFSPEPLQESEPLAAADPPEETPPVATDGVAGDGVSRGSAAPPAQAPLPPEPGQAQEAQAPSPEAEATALGEAERSDLADTVARLLEEAQRLQDRGRSKPALAKFQAVLALSPDASEAMSGIALIHLSAGKSKQAAEFAQRAVTTDSQNAEGYIVLGAAKQALRDREGANQAYKHCAELADPRYSVECRRLAH